MISTKWDRINNFISARSFLSKTFALNQTFQTPGAYPGLINTKLYLVRGAILKSENFEFPKMSPNSRSKFRFEH